MAAGEMEVLLEVDGFDMDRGAEMTLTHAHINVQKCDFGGEDVPSELDGIVAVEAFKEMDEGTMRPKEENVIDKTQPGTGVF